MIGAWCFLDHLSPVGADQPLRVGSHPHIGLQTLLDDCFGMDASRQLGL